MAGKVISLLARGSQAQMKAPPKPLVKGPSELDGLRQALEIALAGLRAEGQARLETMKAELAAARQGLAGASQALAEAHARIEALQAKLGTALAASTGLRVELGAEQDRCADLEARCRQIEQDSTARHAAVMAAIAGIKPARLQVPPKAAPIELPRYEIVPTGRDLNGRAIAYDLRPVKGDK